MQWIWENWSTLGPNDDIYERLTSGSDEGLSVWYLLNCQSEYNIEITVICTSLGVRLKAIRILWHLRRLARKPLKIKTAPFLKLIRTYFNEFSNYIKNFRKYPSTELSRSVYYTFETWSFCMCIFVRAHCKVHWISLHYFAVLRTGVLLRSLTKERCFPTEFWVFLTYIRIILTSFRIEAGSGMDERPPLLRTSKLLTKYKCIYIYISHICK